MLLFASPRLRMEAIFHLRGIACPFRLVLIPVDVMLLVLALEAEIPKPLPFQELVLRETTVLVPSTVDDV